MFKRLIKKIFKSGRLKKTKGYLLVRPEAGWCDQLVQIYKSYKYCLATNRCLIIDTNYPQRLGAGFDFFFDLISSGPQVIYKTEELTDLLKKISDEPSIYPSILKGRLNTYSASFSRDNNGFFYQGIPLKIDFNRNYKEKIIVHHHFRGGYTPELLECLKLSPGLEKEYLHRLGKILKPYVGIHVRNTDKKTECVESFYSECREKFSGKNIFLATDDISTRRKFEEDKAHYKSLSFFSYLPEDGKPLHILRPHEERLQASIDSLCDLWLLASADELYCSTTGSGFARLALALNKKISAQTKLSYKTNSSPA